MCQFRTDKCRAHSTGQKRKFASAKRSSKKVEVARNKKTAICHRRSDCRNTVSRRIIRSTRTSIATVWPSPIHTFPTMILKRIMRSPFRRGPIESCNTMCRCSARTIGHLNCIWMKRTGYEHCFRVESSTWYLGPKKGHRVSNQKFVV